MIIRTMKQGAPRQTKLAKAGSLSKTKKSIALYGLVSLVIVGLVSANYSGIIGQTSSSQVIEANAQAIHDQAVKQDQVTAVDSLASVTSATNIAESVQLPIVGDLREESSSIRIKNELAQNEKSNVITKPKTIQAKSDKRSITTYITKDGDNVASVAAQHKITPETVKWANKLTTDTVEKGKKLTILPVDGVLYEVKDGDKVDDLINKYKADKERVVLFNDLETKQISKGMQLVLPGGVLPEEERPGYVAPPSNTRGGRSQSNAAGGGSTTAGTVGANSSYNKATASAGNKYAAGNCTWWVYEKRLAAGKPIGSFWGNAYSWDDSARAAGNRVDHNPEVGSILQTDAGGGGYGHVAYVTGVNADGSVDISEMNYKGYNVVSTRHIPASSVGSFHFIH